MTHVLVEVSRVSQERRGQKNVPNDGRHLALERLTGRLPATLFHAQRREQRGRPVHLSLHVLKVGLDGLGLGDELRVLFLVGGDTLLQLGYEVLHFLSHLLVRLGLDLQGVQLVSQRFHAFQHVRVFDLKTALVKFGTFFQRVIVTYLPEQWPI